MSYGAAGGTDRQGENRNMSFTNTSRYACILCALFPSLTSTSTFAADALPPWAARQPDGGTVRVAIEPPPGDRFAHLAWPKAVRARDGTIVVAYLAGISHGGSGCPAVSFSTDNGKTFSPPNVLREFGKGTDQANSGNLAIAVAEDGALVLLAMAHTGDTANNIYGWRSTDSARTWTPVDTSTLGPNKTGPVTSMILVPGVGLMATGHYRSGSKPQAKGIWYATSTDHGKTWSDPRPINDVDAGEPVIVRAGERLLVFIRSRTVPGAAQYLAISDDKGKTWKTELTKIGVEKKGTLAHPFAMVNPDKPAELIALTAERPLPGRVWMWRGDPKTLEFKRDRIVLEFPRIAGDKNDDFGYTWVVPTEKGRGLMFYYHGLGKGRCPIWVAEIAY